MIPCHRRVNPVEIIYASFPAFLYLNATLAGRLLEPLLEFQSSSLYSLAYAAPDLGKPLLNLGSWSAMNLDLKVAAGRTYWETIQILHLQLTVSCSAFSESLQT